MPMKSKQYFMRLVGGHTTCRHILSHNNSNHVAKSNSDSATQTDITHIKSMTPQAVVGLNCESMANINPREAANYSSAQTYLSLSGNSPKGTMSSATKSGMGYLNHMKKHLKMPQTSEKYQPKQATTTSKAKTAT